jgi:hypothetical protein
MSDQVPNVVWQDDLNDDRREEDNMWISLFGGVILYPYNMNPLFNPPEGVRVKTNRGSLHYTLLPLVVGSGYMWIKCG